MNDSQLLSAFQELTRPPRRPRPVLAFDACQLGVVLRAVLFVEAVMAVGAMFGAGGVMGWVERVAYLSGAALPGTLGWLVVTFTSAPLGLGSTPCLTAFSTNGCRNKGGTFALPALGSITHSTRSRSPKRTCSIAR